MSDANLNPGGDPASTVGTGGDPAAATPSGEAQPSSDIAAELAKAKELAENYKRRAEKAEAKAKETKQPPAPETPPSTPKKDDSGAFTREEAKIFTQIVNSGLPEELTDAAMERVGKIAALEGISIAEAYKTDDFKVWRDRKVQTYKHEQAQLGASRGGSSTSQVKTFDSPGLTDAEHTALYMQKYGRR